MGMQVASLTLVRAVNDSQPLSSVEWDPRPAKGYMGGQRGTVSWKTHFPPEANSSEE